MQRAHAGLLALTAMSLGGLFAAAARNGGTASAAPGRPPQPVVVEGPLPLPVSGTISAEQGGAWNVGLLGTPSVTIANSPTVNLANSAAQPLFIRNADDPGRIAYQAINSFTSCATATECNWVSPVVPAGHRLVVTHLSGIVQTVSTPQLIRIDVGDGNSGQSITGFRLPLPYATFSNSYDQPVQFYVDAGDSYQLFAFVDGTTLATLPDETKVGFTATGYLLDCTAAPCAPIAQ